MEIYDIVFSRRAGDSFRYSRRKDERRKTPGLFPIVQHIIEKPAVDFVTELPKFGRVVEHHAGCACFLLARHVRRDQDFHLMRALSSGSRPDGWSDARDCFKAIRPV